MILPRVSVIVPMRNEEAFIARCLAAIVAQDYPAELVEILIVDGMSNDRSREIVLDWARQYPRIRLLDNSHCHTPAGLNVGIRAAQGEIIVRVDAHTVIEPDYLRQCVHYLAQTGADNVGGLMRPVGETYWGQCIALATSSPFGVGNSPFHYAETEQFVDTVYMGAFRREVFERVGLFNESLIRNQDYELNYRIRAAGGRIFCTPAIRSHYYPRASLADLWRQYFQYGFWKAYVIRLHPASIQPRHLVAPAFVLAVVGSAFLAVIFRPFLWLLATILATYALAVLGVATAVAGKHGWRYLPGLSAVFAAIHFSWGLGFWWNWIRFLMSRLISAQPESSQTPVETS